MKKQGAPIMTTQRGGDEEGKNKQSKTWNKKGKGNESIWISRGTLWTHEGKRQAVYHPSALEPN